MNKLFITFSLIFVLSFSTWAATETFTINTDASGNGSMTETVPFGTFSLKSFTSTHNFESVTVSLDGKSSFTGTVNAKENYTVSGSARKKIELAVVGGPANTTVTVSVDYTWGEERVETTSRASETFSITTDANGAGTHTETVPFGTFSPLHYTSDVMLSTASVTLDGTTVYSAQNVNAGDLTGSATQSILLNITADANTTVTITLEYNWGAERASLDNRGTTETFTITTDGSGNGSTAETVPFGTFSLLNFQSTHAFTNAVLSLDNTTVYNANVEAGTVYPVTGNARSSINLNVTGGPANTTVTVTVEYTWGEERGLESREIENFVLATDVNGDATDGYDIPFGSFKVNSFVADGDFKKVQVLLDGNIVFDQDVKAGDSYTVNGSGKKKVSLVASGGAAGKEINVAIDYTWSPFLFVLSKKICCSSIFETTDNHGDLRAKTKQEVKNPVTFKGFKSSMNFESFTLLLDGIPVYSAEKPVVAGETYTFEQVLPSGKHHLEMFATGGENESKVKITFYHK